MTDRLFVLLDGDSRQSGPFVRGGRSVGWGLIDAPAAPVAAQRALEAVTVEVETEAPASFDPPAPAEPVATACKGKVKAATSEADSSPLRRPRRAPTRPSAPPGGSK